MPYKDRAVALLKKREWSHAHPNHKRNKIVKALTDRRYALEHKESIAAYQKEYRATHRETARIYACEYGKKKKPSYRYYHTENGKQKILLVQQRYHTRRRGLAATLTAEEWEEIKNQFGYKCVYCGGMAKLTQDHLIPVSKGGGLTKDNIVPACLSCNSKKRDKIIPFRLWYPLDICSKQGLSLS